MKYRNLSLGIMLATGLAAGLAAQSAPQQPPPPQSSQSTSKAPEIKLTGCLTRGQVVNGGSTAVPPGTPAPPPLYKLTQVDPQTLRGAMADEAKRDTGTPPATEIGLRADSKVNLSEHIDHKVELTGKVVAGKSDTKSAMSRDTGTAMTGGIAEVPEFQVTSLRMVASSCQ